MVIEDVVDHTNVGAMLRNAAALGWDGVLLDAAGGRPALPPVDQGEHGRGVHPALGPADRLGGTPELLGRRASPPWR